MKGCGVDISTFRVCTKYFELGSSLLLFATGPFWEPDASKSLPLFRAWLVMISNGMSSRDGGAVSFWMGLGTLGLAFFLMLTLGFGEDLYCHRPGRRFSLNEFGLTTDTGSSCTVFAFVRYEGREVVVSVTDGVITNLELCVCLFLLKRKRQQGKRWNIYIYLKSLIVSLH